MTQPDTQEKLLTAAEKVFSQRGYDAATVKDIADEAGVNISLISYHFGGKEGIYRASFERFGTEGLELIKKILTPPSSREDLKAKLRLYMEQIVDCHIQDEQITRMIHMEVLNGLPHCEEVFRATFQQVFQLLVRFLDSAKKAGLVRAEFAPEITGKLMLGSLMHFCQTDALSRKILNKSISEPKFRQKVIEDALSLMLGGILEANA